MSGAQTNWQGLTQNRWARKLALDAIQQTGRALPCSVVAATGALVTVKFEILSNGVTLDNTEMPLFGPEYIRYPIQPGDKGVCFPVDAQIGAMCGLSAGVADLTQPANLAALVFFPIGNALWSTVDPNAVTIYGPNGVVLRDQASTTTFTLTPAGLTVDGDTEISLSVGPTSVTLTPALLQLQVARTVALTINGIPGYTGTFPRPGGTVTVVNGIIVSV